MLRTSPRLRAFFLGVTSLLLLHGAACQEYNQQRSYEEAAAARETPKFSECVSGGKLSALSNCAEVCQSQNRGCQNYGCDHPDKKADRYGALSYGDSICGGSPQRAMQCYDAFNNEVGVRCCCV